MNTYLLLFSIIILPSILCLNTKGAAQPNCGCQCSDLVWRNKYGAAQGNCRSSDHTKARWCYVKEGSTCSDLVPSKRYPRNPWSYQACATPTQRHCASTGGSYGVSSGGFGSSSGSNSAANGGQGASHSSGQGQFSSAFGGSGTSATIAGILSGINNGGNKRPFGGFGGQGTSNSGHGSTF